MKIINLLFLFFFTVNSSLLVAQKNLPRLSPKAFVGQTIGYTTVTITYGSPGVKEREIWGELVPYGEVWRTGANEATTIEFDNDLYIEGNKIPTGKYSLFTIPNEKEWTIILNKVYDQWGAFKYNMDEDQIRFKVKPIKNHHVERLKFYFQYIEPYKAIVNLEWEKIKIPFLINSEILK
jgi:hypothetical protein